MPSLQQLDDAVRAYMEVDPDALITVVVDATFGHRIDDKEVEAFDAAVANNELVAPPAGAVGRGDAFVLSIADKVGAAILTNDSFQEFHGQYTWLFDEGRIIGGKPVPHIGWVFVNRTPVRGPLSRKSIAESKRKNGRRSSGSAPGSAGQARMGSPEASRPMPVPTKPPPRSAHRPEVTAAIVAAATDDPSASIGDGGGGRRRSGRGRRNAAEPEQAPPAGRSASATASAVPARGEPVNDLLDFLTFVEFHPVGSSVSAVVETYSSHGAYVVVDDVRCYVPLRLMAEPAPRSAREFMKVGESVTLVVESFVAGRRSIDLAVPGMVAGSEPVPAGSSKQSAAKKGPAKRAPAKKVAPPKVAATKAVAEQTGEVPASDVPAKAAPRKRAPAKQAVAKAPVAKKAVARAAVAKEAVATKASSKIATGKSAATEAESARSDAAHVASKGVAPKKAAPKKAASTKAAPTKAAAATAVDAKAAAKKDGPSKVAAKKVAPKRATAAKASAPNVAAKKSPAKKSPAKKSASTSPTG